MEKVEFGSVPIGRSFLTTWQFRNGKVGFDYWEKINETEGRREYHVKQFHKAGLVIPAGTINRHQARVIRAILTKPMNRWPATTVNALQRAGMVYLLFMQNKK